MARPEESLISGPIGVFGRYALSATPHRSPPVRWLTLWAIMVSINDRLEIGEDEVHVWFAYLPPDPGAEREAWNVLTPQSGSEPTG